MVMIMVLIRTKQGAWQPLWSLVQLAGAGDGGDDRWWLHCPTATTTILGIAKSNRFDGRAVNKQTTPGLPEKMSGDLTLNIDLTWMDISCPKCVIIGSIGLWYLFSNPSRALVIPYIVMTVVMVYWIDKWLMKMSNSYMAFCEYNICDITMTHDSDIFSIQIITRTSFCTWNCHKNSAIVHVAIH